MELRQPERLLQPFKGLKQFQQELYAMYRRADSRAEPESPASPPASSVTKLEAARPPDEPSPSLPPTAPRIVRANPAEARRREEAARRLEPASFRYPEGPAEERRREASRPAASPGQASRRDRTPAGPNEDAGSRPVIEIKARTRTQPPPFLPPDGPLRPPTVRSKPFLPPSSPAEEGPRRPTPTIPVVEVERPYIPTIPPAKVEPFPLGIPRISEGTGVSGLMGRVTSGGAGSIRVLLYRSGPLGDPDDAPVEVTLVGVSDDEEYPAGGWIQGVLPFGEGYFYAPPVWLE